MIGLTTLAIIAGIAVGVALGNMEASRLSKKELAAADDYVARMRDPYDRRSSAPTDTWDPSSQESTDEPESFYSVDEAMHEDDDTAISVDESPSTSRDRISQSDSSLNENDAAETSPLDSLTADEDESQIAPPNDPQPTTPTDSSRFQGPFRFANESPDHYRYFYELGSGEEMTRRAGRLEFSPVGPSNQALNESVLEPLKEQLDAISGSVISFSDQPFVRNVYLVPDSPQLTETSLGLLIVTPSGDCWPLLSTDYLGHLLDTPAFFPFANLSRAESEDEWMDQSTFPVLIKVRRDGSVFNRSSLQYKAIRLPNPTDDPLSNLPSATIESLEGREAIGSRDDDYTVLHRDDRLLVIKVDRALTCTGNEGGPFGLNGEEIIGFDRVVGKITYRRLVGTVSGESGSSTRKPIFYEMWLDSEDRPIIDGICLAMGIDTSFEMRVNRSTTLPIVSARLVESHNLKGIYSLSPDGRWLTDFYGTGTRVRDLNEPNIPISWLTHWGEGLVSWDSQSKGFVFNAHYMDEQKLEHVEAFVLQDDRTWEHFDTAINTEGSKVQNEAIAIDVEQDQVLVVNRTGIKCSSLSSGDRNWTVNRRFGCLPFDIVWLDNQIYIITADRLAKYDVESGTETVLREWKVNFEPSLEPTRRARLLSIINERDGLVWVLLQKGLTAYDIRTAEEVATLENSSGMSNSCIASDANLLFALIDKKLVVYSLLDMTVIGEVNVSSYILDPSILSVSQDGRRVLIAANLSTSPAVILDFDF